MGYFLNDPFTFTMHKHSETRTFHNEATILQGYSQVDALANGEPSTLRNCIASCITGEWTWTAIESPIYTDCAEGPFTKFTLGGLENIQWEFVNDDSLLIENTDSGSSDIANSGGFHIKVRPGYQVKLKLTFEDSGDEGFEEVWVDLVNRKDENYQGVLETRQYEGTNVQGDAQTFLEVIFLLKGADEIAINIDDEWDDIPLSKFIVQGLNLTSKGREVDDEVYIELLDIYMEDEENGGGSQNSTGCQSASDCGAGYNCLNGTCVLSQSIETPCTTNSDCATNEVCTSGECVCAAGYELERGQCVEESEMPWGIIGVGLGLVAILFMGGRS